MYFEAEKSFETPTETASGDPIDGLDRSLAAADQPAGDRPAPETPASVVREPATEQPTEPVSANGADDDEDEVAAEASAADPIDGQPDGEPDEELEELPVEPEANEPNLIGCPEALLPALQRRGFTRLTSVQQAVADADDGRRDLRISSQTGSGKTVALGFALLDALHKDDRRGPTTLVIAPTRELAMQVKEELGWLFADVRDVNCEVVTGGTSLERERMRLRRRPNVVVGTPGRLLDHLRRGVLDASSVCQLVLDEADQMLDLGFKDELDGILEHLPTERRTHLVSATFPRAVLDLANRFQRDALEIEGTARGEAHDDIEHIACRIGSREHYQATVNLLLMAGDDRTLVFVRTREDTVRMADKLAADGFAALPINGDLAQAQRTRTLEAFRRGSVRTLIATDVAARGLDIPSVTMVIHVELPIDGATYVHRSGRTGRAGQKGRSVLLVPKSRAPRTQRMYREARLEPRWASAPTAEMVEARQLERAEAMAMDLVDSAPVATPARRAIAAKLLQERDPIEVVAVLLAETMSKTRKPFDLLPTSSPAPRQKKLPPQGHHDAPPARAPRPASKRAEITDTPPANTLGARRGKPGAAPSWRKPQPDSSQPKNAHAPEPGFTRFRINWGTRDGADPRRILAHVCRRGDIDSRMVGSITMEMSGSTFDIADAVAPSFAQRVQTRDRRDPHLFIKPDSGRPAGFAGPQRGAMRTRQSR